MEKEFFEELDKIIENSNTTEDFKNTYNKIKEKLNKDAISEKGKKILEVMKDNEDDLNNIFTAKQIGEFLGTSGRGIASSMRGLVSAGLVSKSGKNPTCYSLLKN